MDAGGGVLSGQTMADTFNALRANDLIWSFFVNNYLMGKEPRPFDLLFWNSDQTRMPKTLHLYYLRKFYQDNALAKGELVLDGVQLDLGKVKTPIYVQSSQGGPHRARPARSTRARRLFGGPVTFTLAGSGHIAGVINRAGRQEVPALDQRRAAADPRGMAWPAPPSIPAPGGRTGKRGWRRNRARRFPPAIRPRGR